jgi:Lar family restriction alleviation protein
MSKKLLPCPFCGGEARIGLTDRTKWGDTITAFCAPCSASVSETGCVQSEATKRKVTEAWNRRTPAPEGAVVAWRWQEYDHPEDPWLYSETGPREHEEHANRQPLYASPVVPVGVSREGIARIIEPEFFSIGRAGPGYEPHRASAFRKADAILAALRFTDTGEDT